LIDAYAHIGMPRFQTADGYRSLMADLGIKKALVCPFDACPDLHRVHAALADGSGEFRGLGLVLGHDRAEKELGLQAQLDAGFAGLRLGVHEILADPWALDRLGERKALPFVTGEKGLADAAALLVQHLERFPDSHVIGGHFAGPTETDVLTRAGPVRDLFRHPRFSVVFSRQGIFPKATVEAWADALVELLGWDRILWATEAPVLIWRDEAVLETPKWIERFALSASQREAFFTGNSQRLIFDLPIAAPKPLKLPFDPFAFDPDRRVPMWPFGLSMSTRLPGRLIEGWRQWGGERRGPLSHYLDDVLDAALPRFE
jgi:predicted TIM-barrel fold metal-dependent hydrolase